MEKLKRTIAIKNFLETTTFHGLCYINTKKRATKVLWSSIVFISSLLIILSTILMLSKYLSYDYYMITEEEEVSKLEEIPNLLVCSSHKLSLVDSIVELRPDLQASSIINFNLIEDLKIEFKKRKTIVLNKCEIKIRSTIKIDCMKFKTNILFTFNGFCLLIDFQELKQNETLLMKEFNILRHFIDYKAHLFLVFNKLNASESKLSFKFVKENSIFSQTDLKLLFSNYYFRKPSVKYYDAVLEHVEYDKALYNRNCESSDYDNEVSCQYEHLKRKIKEEVECDFAFNHTTCTLEQLMRVENLIATMNNTFSSCLPSCKSLKYNLIEISGIEESDSRQNRFFEWNFYLNFKIINIKYVLNFDSAALLNFINGLWSLFLGISILSIWELVELVNSLFVVNQRCFLFTKFEGKNKLSGLLNLIFHDTLLHGFRNIFTSSRSYSFKLRWTLVVILATFGFCFSVTSLVREYRNYNSDLNEVVESVYNNKESYLKRKITFFACEPLDFVNKTNRSFFIRLNAAANDLFQSSSNLSAIKKQYKRMFELNTLMVSSSYYSTVFSLAPISFVIGDENATRNAQVYFDDSCAWFHSNSTLADWHDQKIKEKILIKTESSASFEGFLLDSQSLHISEESQFIIIDKFSRPIINGVLKYKKFLPSPYRPSCNPDADYKQHECYQTCFNDIVYREFGCRVLFGEYGDGDTAQYCHPWMLPLIQNYEKHVLRNHNRDPCIECNRKPCEYFYYALEEDYDTLLSYNSLSNIIQTTKQTPVLTFENALIVTLSYFSLLYGGSILAIIHILFNLVTRIPIMKRFENRELFSFLKHFSCILDLFSKSTTIHCMKYLSAKNANDCKKLFWVISMCATIVVAISISIQEIVKYEQSKLTSHRTESWDGDNWRPRLDICRTLNDPTVYLTAKYDSLDVSDYLEEIQSLSKETNGSLSDMKDLIKRYFDEFEQGISSNSNYASLLNVTWSHLIGDYMDEYTGRVTVLNGMKWKRNELESTLNVNSPTRVYQSSLLYYDVDTSFSMKSFSILFCKSIDVLTSINNNQQLTSQEKSQIGITFEHVNAVYPNDYNLYLENYLLSPVLDFLSSNGDFKRIKRIYKDYNYKYACSRDRENCVFNSKYLQDYSEYQLFLCNEEFRLAIYEIFNCTPFINKTSQVAECSIGSTFLINKIMSKYKIELFKCEISTAAFPIEYESTLLPMNYARYNRSLLGIDLNGVKVYKQRIVEEYDALQLIVNVSNWLNVLIGFSFITICEFLFIIFVHYKKSSFTGKVSAITRSQ